ncbi:MAG: arsenite methyltransferase [Lentimicrobium sp.]|nr:arsenite methyltransferase [Lentimicrobium sp.]
MSKSDNELKNIVKDKYSKISQQKDETSCCGSTGCCGEVDYTMFSESYTHLQGYNPDADLGLGCGIPTEFAHIRKGDTVIDLGSGAGNDCFVARSLVGENGKVIGIDFTDAMLEKARSNAQKLGYNNVEFRFGDIEKLPVTANKADVIISNCVLNLVPDKAKAFGEIFRVLKPGGNISVSDVVLRGKLPENLKQAAEMYAGCVSGAIQMNEYLEIIKNSGLEKIKIQKEKVISIPGEILLNYLNQEELDSFKVSGTGIYSITVYAEKPKQVQDCGCNCSC